MTNNSDRSMISQACRPLTEQLESRMHFAVGVDAFGAANFTVRGQKIVAAPYEWVVTLKPESAASESLSKSGWIAGTKVQQLLGANKLLFNRADFLGDARTLNISFRSSLSPDEVFDFLEASPAVEGFQPNVIGEFAQVTANDPNANPLQTSTFRQQWLKVIKAQSETTGKTGAWDYTTGSPSVAVAVIDNGVLTQHADLTDNIFRYPLDSVDGIDTDRNLKPDDYKGWNFVGNNNDARPAAIAGDGYAETHGTSIAGIIAGDGNNGQGVAGVSWSSKILPLRIGDTQDLSTSRISYFVAALKYVRDLNTRGANIRVINASLVYSNAELTASGKDSPLRSEIRLLRDSGVTIVAAAGNQSRSIDDTEKQIYPASYDYSNIISVAMVNENQPIADTTLQVRSNFGPISVDVAAPGGETGATESTKGIWSTRWQSAIANTNDYGEDVSPSKGIRGTSFATPMVAGTLALLLSINPEAPNDVLRTCILTGMQPIEPSFYDHDANPSTPQIERKLANNGGILNALEAVKKMRTTYLNGGYDDTYLGDDGGFLFDDIFALRVKAGTNNTMAELVRAKRGGGEEVVDSFPNLSTYRVALFTLKGDDEINIASGVNTRFFIHGGTGTDVVTGFDTSDTLASASGGSGSRMAPLAFSALLWPNDPTLAPTEEDKIDRGWLLGMFA